MAGDWIKMRGNLWDDPRIGAVVDATKSREACVIGGLYWLWVTADQHTTDGSMPGMSAAQIDRKTGIEGLAAALQRIGWIEEIPNGIKICRFAEHNGASAKRRVTEAQRKAESRKPMSASDADKLRTSTGHRPDKSGQVAELEKRREEKREEIDTGDSIATTTTADGAPDPFDTFWKAYPRKVGKDAARTAFAKRRPGAALVARMVAAITEQKRSPQWTDRGGQFIPNPATWLNQGRWDDEGITVDAGAPSGPDPELERIIADRAKAVPPSAEVRAAMQALRRKPSA